MDIDPPDELSKRVEALKNLVSAKSPLQSSLSKLSGSLSGIPSGKDFHFYNNFPEFKTPIKQTDENSKQMLQEIGGASELWGKELPFRDDYNDMDVEAHDWLVNVNDEVVERVDASIDDFRTIRKKEEESGVKMMKVGGDEDGEGGFQMVNGKKNKRGGSTCGEGSGGGGGGGVEKREEAAKKVQVAAKVKPRIPFHIPTIRRPQDEYRIIVNNSNQPFEHVWLQKTEDGKFIHPLEKFSHVDFVDRNVTKIVPVKPPPIECTPFTLVEEVKDLKALAGKLRSVDEFAVDLEHNQYRSFQGLTCLMQISTRTEDFIIDTLKLRIQIGPYLREVFKDPTKKKVMHGADRDIMWLQRDFGIYVCNLFDTFQASKVLKLERNSLEYLLNHFCGVTANKEYQNADWRLRPIPDVMLRYGREDTHYLLYIYDLMRMKLHLLDADSEHSGSSLLEVYKHSFDTCMRLYEKELLTDTSYQNIYGLQGAGLSAEQLAVVAGLIEWRDSIARSEDESTGFILPNKILIEIAKEIPLTTSNLRRSLKTKLPYVERNLEAVVSIIRHSIRNASSFEAAAEVLKVPRKETGSQKTSATTDRSEAIEPGHVERKTSPKLVYVHQGDASAGPYSVPGGGTDLKGSSDTPGESDNVKSETDGYRADVPKQLDTICELSRVKDGAINLLPMAAATVPVLKKPSRAFGALLGNSAKRKFQSDRNGPEQMRLEQIKSEVNLPFQAFVVRAAPAAAPARAPAPAPAPAPEAPAKPLKVAPCEEPRPNTSSRVEDVILLDSDDEVINDNSKTAEIDMDQTENQDNLRTAEIDMYQTENQENSQSAEIDIDGTENQDADPALEIDEGDDAMPLYEFSSSFQNSESIDETRIASPSEPRREPEGLVQLEPFDYETARKQVKFGEDRRKVRADGDEDSVTRTGKGHRKSSAVIGQPQKDEVTIDLPQGKRRQAFPASGNRSATFC